ncbi:hypothetical protein QTP70_014113, partial [Hemibagrus guttatus]
MYPEETPEAQGEHANSTHSIDAPGLSGDAVSAVVDRHQGVNCQLAAFKEFIPRRSEKPGSLSSLTCRPPDRAGRKASVAARAPLPKSGEAGQRAQAQARQMRPDLRSVISA